MKSLIDYTDNKGFIGHGSPGNLEFGDGAQRLGTIWVKRFVRMSEPQYEVLKEGMAKNFLEQLELIHLESGEWVRHWDSLQWWGQPGTMSRDQMDPLLMAMILWAPHNKEIETLAKEAVLTIIKRGGFLWNYRHIWPQPGDKPKLITDFFGISILGHAIRLWKIKVLYPLLPIIDLPLVFNSILRVIVGYHDPTEVGDDLNHQIRLVFNDLKVPVLVGTIAKYIYKKFRPKAAYINGVYSDSEPIRAAWEIYFAQPSAPPLDVEWAYVQDRFF